ncbi:unnamed protein product, partial [Brassica rapa subsp. narinosa]
DNTKLYASRSSSSPFFTIVSVLPIQNSTINTPLHLHPSIPSL